MRPQSPPIHWPTSRARAFQPSHKPEAGLERLMLPMSSDQSRTPRDTSLQTHALHQTTIYILPWCFARFHISTCAAVNPNALDLVGAALQRTFHALQEPQPTFKYHSFPCLTGVYSITTWQPTEAWQCTTMV